MCEERRGAAVQRLCPVVILAPAPSDVHPRSKPPPPASSSTDVLLWSRKRILPRFRLVRINGPATSLRPRSTSLATFLMKRTTTRGEVVVVGRGSIGFSSDSSAFESAAGSPSIVDSWPRRRGFESELSPARSF